MASPNNAAGQVAGRIGKFKYRGDQPIKIKHIGGIVTGHNLPAEKGAITWMRGPLGGLFSLPWFDRASMYFLRKLYLPLSRLWGAADEAHGSLTRFIQITQIDANATQLERIRKVIFEFEVSRARVNAIDTAWREAFFGGGGATPTISFELKPDCAWQNSIDSSFHATGSPRSRRGPSSSPLAAWPRDRA